MLYSSYSPILTVCVGLVISDVPCELQITLILAKPGSAEAGMVNVPISVCAPKLDADEVYTCSPASVNTPFLL